jgi:transposase-like protein
MKRVTPSKRAGQEIEELLEDDSGADLLHALQQTGLAKPISEAVEAWLNNIYMAPTYEVGCSLSSEFIKLYGDKFPRAVASFRDDLEASLTHLRFPLNFRRGIPTGNSIERLFGEQKRRTKVIPFFFDEKSCLKLVFAALIRAARGFRRFKISELAVARLESLRKEKKLVDKPSLDDEPARKLRSVA